MSEALAAIASPHVLGRMMFDYLTRWRSFVDS